MPYDSKESKYDDHSAEEVVSDNILPEFFEYIQSAKFQSQIEQFCEQHAHLFDGSEGKCSNTKEFTHEHKAIFDDYQALIDKLFSSFARDHRMEVADLYDCCRDTGMKDYDYNQLSLPCCIYS